MTSRRKDARPTPAERLPEMPADATAEVACLAAAIQAEDAAHLVATSLQRSDFTTDERQAIFTALQRLEARRDAVNPLSLWHELQRLGEPAVTIPKTALTDLADLGPSASYVQQSIQYVRKAARRRLLITAGESIAQGARENGHDESALLEDFWTATRALDAGAIQSPRVLRYGDDFAFLWDPLGIEVRSERLREGTDGVHAELSVSLHGRLRKLSTRMRHSR